MPQIGHLPLQVANENPSRGNEQESRSSGHHIDKEFRHVPHPRL